MDETNEDMHWFVIFTDIHQMTNLFEHLVNNFVTICPPLTHGQSKWTLKRHLSAEIAPPLLALDGTCMESEMAPVLDTSNVGTETACVHS